jgi:DNA-binding CsgD family transcriptional regulator
MRSVANLHSALRIQVQKYIGQNLNAHPSEGFKFLENFLKNDETLYLLEQVNGFVCIFNYAQSIYEFVSENVKRELGHEASLLIGEEGKEKLTSLFHPNQIPSLIRSMEDSLKYFSEHATIDTGCQYRHTSCMKFKNSQDVYKWFLVDKTIIQVDESGFPIRSFITCTNIHDFKKDEILFLNILKKDDSGTYQTVYQNTYNESLTHAEDNLTKRELEIVKFIADGYTNENIAQKLFISLNTVKTHRKFIMKKTNCKGTAELTRLAFSMGII